MNQKTKEDLKELTDMYASACEREKRAYGEYVAAKEHLEHISNRLSNFIDELPVDEESCNAIPPKPIYATEAQEGKTTQFSAGGFRVTETPEPETAHFAAETSSSKLQCRDCKHWHWNGTIGKCVIQREEASPMPAYCLSFEAVNDQGGATSMVCCNCKRWTRSADNPNVGMCRTVCPAESTRAENCVNFVASPVKLP